MILSEDRQSHLCHLIVDGLWKDDIVDYSDDGKALRAAKKGMQKFIAEYQEIDTKVRGMVASLKRGVMEGTPEWDIMYSKYFEQELQKRGE